MTTDLAERDHWALNLIALQRFYDTEMRFIAGGGTDFDDLAACLHPEAVFVHGPSSPFAGRWSGLDEIAEMFRLLAGTYATGNDLRLRYYVDDDSDEVAVYMALRVASRATGTTFELRLGQFVAFDGGLIRTFTTYYLDPVGAREACGMGAPTD